MLVIPMSSEDLYLYLSTTKKVVSIVLVTKRENEQVPIYYIGQALTFFNKSTYTWKNMYSPKNGCKKVEILLWRTFYHHPYVSLIQECLTKPSILGTHITIELSEFDKHFKPSLATKGQVIIYFIVD